MKQDSIELEEMRVVEEEADAHEPLIVGQNEADAEGDANGRKGKGKGHTSLRSAGRTLWLVTLSAGISGLLFGYDTGVISSTLVSVGSDLSNRPLTTVDKSLITAITSLFALLTAPATGYLADKYGRRMVILIANLLFILGAFVQAISAYVPMMVVGRGAVGAAVGLSSCATPLYITELSPAPMRGRMVTIQSLFITGGQVVAYLIGWMFAHLPSGWRWMVGLGAVPAIAQLCLLSVMFETPRWLVQAGQAQRARMVLAKVYSSLDEDERQRAVENVLASIQAEIAESETFNGITHYNFRAMTRALFVVPSNRRALTIASTLQALQQLCGFNSLMYFSASIFAMVGFSSPILTSLTVAVTNFTFTVVAFNYIDKIGRRAILLRSIPFMIVGLVVCGVCFIFIYVAPEGQRTLYYANGSPWPLTLVASIMLYVAAYAIGLGCVPWQQSELFPLRVRSLGSGIATATNWSSNFVIGISFLPMMEFLSPVVTFGLYAVICLVGWMVIWRIYPETAGLELEGVGELLRDGYGVKQSVRRFREGNAMKRRNRKDEDVDLPP